MATASVPKGSVLEEEEEIKDSIVPDYSPEQITYLGNLQTKLESAKTQRDQVHVEFDNLDYISHYWANERGANTYLKYKDNKGDPVFQSGTLRTKLMSFVSTLQGLNLSPDISAFNLNEFPISYIGDGMEDIMEKCDEAQNDKEAQSLRQYEMTKQGSVHVEVLWEDRWVIEKTMKKKLDSPDFITGKGENLWSTKRVKADGMPVKRIIPNPALYKGDMTEYDLEKQPYIYTLEIKEYDDCRSIYEKWPMWKYVTKKKRSFSGTAGEDIANNAWRLTDDSKDQVEVIKYQDRLNNEFQIILNGVPMLPMGYPLSEFAPGGGYTIVQQNLEPIRHNFSEGKSFIFRNKNLVAILDKMMKMGVLKTWKSFEPAYLNTSGRVVSRDIFRPGNITMGIQPNTIVPINDQEVKGVTAGEFNFIQEVVRTIDRQTVSQTSAGAREQDSNRTTATQILEQKRAANIMIGLTVMAAALLEWKIRHKELALLLQKWFDPVDQTVDKARQVLKNKYRTVSRPRNIEGEGQGIRMTIPSENIPSSNEIRAMEKEAKRKLGFPLKAIFINPKEIKKAKYIWQININPREKKSSEFNKIMFDEMILRIQSLGWPLNPDWGMNRFAEVWEEDASKMFLRGPQPPAMGQGGQTAPQGTSEALQGVQGRQKARPGVSPVKVAPKAEIAAPGGAMGR